MFVPLIVGLMIGGTASHVHVSLKNSSVSPDAEIEGAPGLNILETEFIAGLMDHLQAIAAFTMPTIASYERLMDGAWAVIFSSLIRSHKVGGYIYLLGSRK